MIPKTMDRVVTLRAHFSELFMEWRSSNTENHATKLSTAKAIHLGNRADDSS
jgi:hypothetical protein